MTQETLGRRLQVLVVENHADTRDSMALLLQLFGYEVEVAADGAEAIRLATGKDLDVLLMDIGLPGENGYAVARRLCALLPKRPLLIAMTGLSGASHQRSQAEGFDHHLVKPDETRRLEQILEQVAAQARLKEEAVLCPGLTAKKGQADLVSAGASA